MTRLLRIVVILTTIVAMIVVYSWTPGVQFEKEAVGHLNAGGDVHLTDAACRAANLDKIANYAYVKFATGLTVEGCWLLLDGLVVLIVDGETFSYSPNLFAPPASTIAPPETEV